MKTKLLTVAIAGGLVVTGIGTHPANAAAATSPVSLAQQSIGESYSWGGNDCSGLTMRIFAHFGVSLPHSSAAQASYGTSVSRGDLQPGDLVFFHTSKTGSGISHVGIYVGNNRMISAENESAGVVETQIFGGGASSYWAPRFVTARRISVNGSASTVTASANRPAAASVTAPKQSTSATTSSASTVSSSSGNSGSTAAADQDSASSQQTAAKASTAASQSTATTAVQKSAAASAVSTANQSAAKTAHPAVSTTQSDVQKTTPAQKTTAASSGVYVIAAGDTLWAIAANNGLTVTQLEKYNQLSDSQIYPGQKLQLSNPKQSYTIKAGDTLWQIARANGTTVQQLMKDNHLTSDLIFPERVLSIVHG